MPRIIIPKTIIEGTWMSHPYRPCYEGYSYEIPLGVLNLVKDDNTEYPLYARTLDFKTLERLADFFEPPIRRKGFPIKRVIQNFSYIFDNQRSVITSDGRVYVNSGYFSNGNRIYLKRIPQIIQDCRRVFSGELGVHNISSK